MREMKLPGGLLERGFWIYVWEVTPPRGRKRLYVGMTGDTGYRKAQSPFNRVSAHLGHNNANNTLRKELNNARPRIDPETCQFRFLAHRVYDLPYSKHKRNVVAAIEMKLRDCLKAAGYEVLNEVHCRQLLSDQRAWRNVHRAFKRHFRKL